MSTVFAALDIVRVAFEDKTDRAGKPYIGHLRRVASKMHTVGAECVAWLHDLLEDTDWTIEDLRNHLYGGQPAFSNEILEAIEAITHKEGQSYEDYIEQVAQNPLATMVKLEDLRDNMDITRLPRLTDRDIERLKKYHKAYLRLTNE